MRNRKLIAIATPKGEITDLLNTCISTGVHVLISSGAREGASKRLAEIIINSIPKRNTEFMAVRFGNVLGSHGSAVPFFERQIRVGGPVTVTHPEITRYFMTIPEAASLVLQAVSIAKGGELFILDMGTPVRLVELAQK